MFWFARADREYPGQGLFWFGNQMFRRIETAGRVDILFYVDRKGPELGGALPNNILALGSGTTLRPAIRENFDGMGPEWAPGLTMDQVKTAVREVVDESSDIEIDAEDVAARVDAKLAARFAS